MLSAKERKEIIHAIREKFGEIPLDDIEDALEKHTDEMEILRDVDPELLCRIVMTVMVPLLKFVGGMQAQDVLRVQDGASDMFSIYEVLGEEGIEGLIERVRENFEEE